MLDRVWLRLTRLSLRLEKFYVASSSAAFFMAWLSVGVLATRHWHTTLTDSHLWVISLLYFSLLLWVGLLRGETRRNVTILCLAFMLGVAGQLWFSYLH
jgi:hypothetical protein